MKMKILALQANPEDRTRLRLGEESREIEQRLTVAQAPYEFRVKGAVRAEDLQLLLLQNKPDIVHYSGHGSFTGELELEDASGTTKVLIHRRRCPQFGRPACSIILRARFGVYAGTSKAEASES
jgi:hypothetical protein